MVVEDLCQTIDNCKLERVSEQTGELLSYFQKTYLKGEGLVEREPTFPINLWNHFNDAADGLIRTTLIDATHLKKFHCSLLVNV